jgi:hypothetical protein
MISAQTLESLRAGVALHPVPVKILAPAYGHYGHSYGGGGGIGSTIAHLVLASAIWHLVERQSSPVLVVLVVLAVLVLLVIQHHARRRWSRRV